MDALTHAINLAGSQANLAKIVGVSSQALNQWVRGTRPIPVKKVLKIEGWSEGAITREALRPDIFGEPKAEAAA